MARIVMKNPYYEEIKNRKGKMVNGTFVKEEDL